MTVGNDQMLDPNPKKRIETYKLVTVGIIAVIIIIASVLAFRGQLKPKPEPKPEPKPIFTPFAVEHPIITIFICIISVGVLGTAGYYDRKQQRKNRFLKGIYKDWNPKNNYNSAQRMCYAILTEDIDTQNHIISNELVDWKAVTIDLVDTVTDLKFMQEVIKSNPKIKWYFDTIICNSRVLEIVKHYSTHINSVNKKYIDNLCKFPKHEVNKILFEIMGRNNNTKTMTDIIDYTPDEYLLSYIRYCKSMNKVFDLYFNEYLSIILTKEPYILEAMIPSDVDVNEFVKIGFFTDLKYEKFYKIISKFKHHKFSADVINSANSKVLDEMFVNGARIEPYKVSPLEICIAAIYGTIMFGLITAGLFMKWPGLLNIIFIVGLCMIPIYFNESKEKYDQAKKRLARNFTLVKNP